MIGEPFRLLSPREDELPPAWLCIQHTGPCGPDCAPPRHVSATMETHGAPIFELGVMSVVVRPGIAKRRLDVARHGHHPQRVGPGRRGTSLAVCAGLPPEPWEWRHAYDAENIAEHFRLRELYGWRRDV